MSVKAPFKATFARWLSSHERIHKEYYSRKHYPWGILSKIDFTPNPLVYEQLFVTSNHESPITFTGFENDENEGRYIYELNFVREHEHLKFRTVFSYEGELITIFRLQDPIQKIYRSLWSNKFGGKVTMDIKKGESMLRQLIVDQVQLGEEWNIVSGYETLDITEQLRDELLKLKAKKLKKGHIVVPFSQERNLWINIFLTKSRAMRFGLAESTQCQEYHALYLIDDHPSFQKSDLLEIKYVDVKRYFHRQLSLKDLQALRNLEEITYL
ncbi:MAG: hypothetical protein ABS942_16045 [Solibacillus sp.]